MQTRHSMFAAIVGSHKDELRPAIEAMANALRGNALAPRIHVDGARGFAVCGVSSGILPEDRFDAQPYVDDALCFVAEGRVDNRDELLARLERNAAEKNGMSDAMFLLLAYQRWGSECNQHLRGQYTFLAIQKDSRDVFCSVDHLGMSHVFYAQQGETLIFASQMGAMRAHPLLRSLTPDVETTALLVPGLPPANKSAVRGIASLPGGCGLSAKQSTIAIRRWWRPSEGHVLRYRSPEEYVQHASAVFAECVRARLRTAGEVSATVSGGLDSSLVTAVAAMQLRERDQTLAMYTSVPQAGVACLERVGWDANEIGLVREIATLHPNASCTAVSFDGVNPVDVMRETHALSHTPVRNTANQVWFRAMSHKARAKNSRVLLTGQWGNATISIAGNAMAGRLLSQRPLFGLRLLRQNARTGGRPVRSVLQAEVRARLAALRNRSTLPPGAEYLSEQARQWLRPRTIAEGDLRDPNVQLRYATHPYPGCYREEMVHSGVEYRDPTSDRRLIELLLKFPPEALLAGGRMRGLARELGAGIVPDSIRLRRRRGLQVPDLCGQIALHRASYREALDAMQRSPACRENLQLERASHDLERLSGGAMDMTAAIMLDRVMDVGTFWTDNGI